jgi:hypothetical protein
MILNCSITTGRLRIPDLELALIGQILKVKFTIKKFFDKCLPKKIKTHCLSEYGQTYGQVWLLFNHCN